MEKRGLNPQIFERGAPGGLWNGLTPAEWHKQNTVNLNVLRLAAASNV